jgi:DNA-directed RNA polymerase I subunit RPA43
VCYLTRSTEHQTDFTYRTRTPPFTFGFGIDSNKVNLRRMNVSPSEIPNQDTESGSNENKESNDHSSSDVPNNASDKKVDGNDNASVDDDMNTEETPTPESASSKHIDAIASEPSPTNDIDTDNTPKDAEPTAGTEDSSSPTSNATPSGTDSTPANPTRTISKPPKRGRTAYFIFMSYTRPKVQSENEGKSIGTIAKIMGLLWKDLDPVAKQVYIDKAKKEKEQYVEDRKLYLEQHPEDKLNNADASSQKNEKNKDPLSLTYPVARIRKISRLDPEVKGLSKEALLAITKAAELFTEKFGNETHSMAQMQKRRKILNQDLIDVVSLKEPFFFLKEDLLDLVKLQQQKPQEEQEHGKVGAAGKKKIKGGLSEKAAKAVANTRPMTSFFKAK